jgi:hypothetical protein
VKEAVKRAKDIAEHVVAHQLDVSGDIFDKADKEIAAGEKHGISF